MSGKKGDWKLTELELLTQINEKIEILLILYLSFQIIGRIYPILRSIVKGIRK